jgi:hypothetical protein
MNFFPTGISCARRAQGTGLSGEITLHGRMIGLLVHHLLPEHFSYQPGNARVLLGGLYPCPSGNFFFQGNGNVFHNIILVQHEVCVNNEMPSERWMECRGEYKKSDE